MSEMIGREALNYSETREGVNLDKSMHCISCRMFVDEEYLGKGAVDDKCVLLGSDVPVSEWWSCNKYEPWPTPDGEPNIETVKNHAAELKKGMIGVETPESAGLVKRKVQCHRCSWPEDKGVTKCGFFKLLNSKLPADSFYFDPAIKWHACCAVQTPKDGNIMAAAEAGVKQALAKFKAGQ